jgi:hypothetical protein
MNFQIPLVGWRSHWPFSLAQSGQQSTGHPSDCRSLPKKHSFETVLQADVPHGRNGKHKEIITNMLHDLAQLKDGSALKIPLKEMASKEKICSALNRASRKLNLVVATAADSEFLYVWNCKRGE